MTIKTSALAVVLGTFAALSFGPAAEAAESRAKPVVTAREGGLQVNKARYSRKYTVRSRAYRRIGFYSYSYHDVINTYGMSRVRYGSINSYRDPFVDRQTVNGPFDHGFFFDSGMAPRGGDSPYLR